MATSNRIKNVALVGAAGNVGKFMTEELLKTGKHVITAITRSDSTSSFPEGVLVSRVDYTKPETLVEALRGKDALVIALAGTAPPETDSKLINAAGEAGVPWIFPSDWSADTANEEISKDLFFHGPKIANRKAIEDLGKSSYISVLTGYWYEYCLAIPPAFGFDFETHTVTIFDDGEAKLSVSTWPQVGRALAALLSLPVEAEGEDKNACLNSLRNKCVYVKSFTISQKEVFASVLRVSGSKEEDWKITHEPAKERFTAGVKEFQAGQRSGIAKMAFTRYFFPDGSGDFEHNKGTLNGLLDLPEEDIDEFTKIAIERSKLPKWVDGHD